MATPPPSVPVDALPPGSVGRAGPWAVAHRPSGVSAVSARCRHQLADLSTGSLDADGCLVCPWHGSRYDLESGAMVSGPQGFLGYRGPTPGYSAAIKAFGRVVRLRVRRVVRVGGAYEVR